jgi:Fusaric acid resistance protein-like
MSRLLKLFELDRKGLNLPRAVVVVVLVVVPLIILSLLGQERYFTSLAFGAVFVGLSDPGGEYGQRLRRMVLFALIGALLTALAFWVGDRAWELVVVAAFLVTLLSGLAVKYGLRRFVAGLLLNAWFIVALALPAGFRLDGVVSHTWAQVLAWLSGAALWIAFTFVMWLARGRTARPQPVPEIPGDTTSKPLSRPVVLFALIRALALALAVGIAFGLHLPNADWMPIATMVALKPSLEQSTLVAAQRLAGAILGAAIASIVILTVDKKLALEAAVTILAAAGVAIRAVNYALYTAAIAGAVLIDISHPSKLGDEVQRVLYTFVGVGIGVVVMLLADQLQKRGPKGAQQPQAT